MSDRIHQLEDFIKEDPSDPFNYYALGLEYITKSESTALAIFKRLVQEHKDYVPTYYQLAKLYEQLGQRDNALQIYHEGIVIARQQNDLKTLRELSAGLETLENDW